MAVGGATGLVVAAEGAAGSVVAAEGAAGSVMAAGGATGSVMAVEVEAEPPLVTLFPFEPGFLMNLGANELMRSPRVGRREIGAGGSGGVLIDPTASVI